MRIILKTDAKITCVMDAMYWTAFQPKHLFSETVVKHCNQVKTD